MQNNIDMIAYGFKEFLKIEYKQSPKVEWDISDMANLFDPSRVETSLKSIKNYIKKPSKKDPVTVTTQILEKRERKEIYRIFKRDIIKKLISRKNY